MDHTPRIAQVANPLQETSTFCLKCAGQIALKDSMQMTTQENAKCVQYRKDALSANTT